MVRNIKKGRKPGSDADDVITTLDLMNEYALYCIVKEGKGA